MALQPRLTAEQIAELRARYELGQRHKVGRIARDFYLSVSAVYGYVNGKVKTARKPRT